MPNATKISCLCRLDRSSFKKVPTIGPGNDLENVPRIDSGNVLEIVPRIDDLEKIHEFVTSFPGRSRLQSLIACRMQKVWEIESHA